MARTGSISKRSLVAAMIFVVVASGCAASTASRSATSGPATGEASAQPVSEKLTGGRYLFGPSGTRHRDDRGDGTERLGRLPSWAMDGPEPVRADAPTGIGISFFTANGLYSDPCHWDVQGTGDAERPATWRSVRPSMTWWPRSAPTRPTRHRSRRR